MSSVLGQRLAGLRKQHKISGQKLANMVGVTQAYISYIENADMPSPNVDLLAKIAKVFDVSTDYLLGKTSHQRNASPAFAAILSDWLDERPVRLPELAERANMFEEDIKRYASGEIEPSGGNMHILLDAMRSMGWKPKMAGDAQKEDGGTPVFDVPSSRGETLRIPILSREKSACCGQGFPNSSEIYADMYDYLDMPAALVGVVSTEPELRPYFMYADGDSMIRAGIMDGFLVLVNPAEPVYDGDSALVEYGIDGNIAIKRVYWLAEGAVKIASADDSGWSRTFSREEIQEQGLFRVKGRIMFAGIRPKRG